MYIRKFFYLCVALIALGCSESNRTDDTDAQIALQFRTAINVNDVNTLVNISQLPFTTIEQQWESAKDGSGFVLGERKVIRIEKKEALLSYFKTIVPRINIEAEQGHFVLTSEYDNLKIELAESIDDWRNLKTYLFKRGEADVEHIVLIGIQARSHKVKTMYIN